MFNKKSQAALEFLMTYGWAILVVMVAVAALAYFGVLSPDKFLPAKCTLQSGIACLDFKVQAAPVGEPAPNGNGIVTVVIQNSLGFDLKDVIVKAGDCGNSITNPPVLPANYPTLDNGEQKTFTINCVTQIASAKYNKQLNITYTVITTSITHTNLGQLTTRVE